MKGLLFGSTLCALGLFLLPTQQVYAACVQESGPKQFSASNPAYSARFGAWVDVLALTSGDEGTFCNSERTDINNYPTYGFSKERSESSTVKKSDYKTYNVGLPNEYKLLTTASSHASANISTASVTSTVSRYHSAYNSIKNNVEMIDLVQIYSPNASATSVTLIPVKFCSKASSEYNSNGSEFSNISYKDFNTVSSHGTDYSSKDLLYLDGSYSITHPSNGEICRSGHLKMTGNYIYFSLRLKAYTLGNRATLTVPTFDDNTTVITAYDGSITADFNMRLPFGLGLKCYSASGSFPGCERPIPNKVLACNASGGNPINFALGVKYQRENDYNSGLLSLSRMCPSSNDLRHIGRI